MWKFIAFVTFMANVLNPGSSCNQQLPGIGPRLMRAKTFFGDFMRMCKKELLELAKILPSVDVKRVLRLYCHFYNACKDMAMKESNKLHLTEEQMIDKFFGCGITTLQSLNTSQYPHITWSDKHKQNFEMVLVCAQEIGWKQSMQLQAIDDAIAFGHKAILSFGWT